MKIKKCLFLFTITLLSCLSISNCFAIADIGSVANTINEGVSGLGQFFMDLFFSISFGFFIGALIKYRAYRNSPNHVTLSVPITLLIFSLAFLILAMILYFSPPKNDNPIHFAEIEGVY